MIIYLAQYHDDQTFDASMFQRYQLLWATFLDKDISWKAHESKRWRYEEPLKALNL